MNLKCILKSQKQFRIVLSCLITVFCFSFNGIAQSHNKPNVVIIFTDDQGYGDVGCYGNKNIRTPHLDKMASDGILFTDFYVAAAVCTPSRAALLTGCYPQRVGLPSVLFPNSMPRGQQDGMALGLNPEETTIAELLQKHGYATACVGKWHLGDLPDFMPWSQGFDEYYGLPYSNDMIPGATKHDFPPIPLYDGKRVIESNPDQDFLTKRYTEKALDFIKRNQDKPFFLYLAHSMPHRPCHVSDSLASLRFTEEQLSGISGEDKESRDFLYPAAIEELDWSVGEILKKLEALGLEDNTLVIFTSDNGPAVGSTGPLRGRKGSMYEAGMRVPCIMKWEGTIPKGTKCNKICASIDFYPTLANLSGIGLPHDAIIDGVDISGLLLGNEKLHPRNQFLYFDQNRGLKAIRKGKWKLFTGNTPQLYNLENDIGEKNNLAVDYPEKVHQLNEIARLHAAELNENKREPGLIQMNQ